MASDSGWVLLLRFLRQALSIAVIAVLVRLLTKDQFGHYQLVLTLVGVLTFTALPGVQRAIVQSVARGYPGTFRAGTRLAFRFSLFGTLLLSGLAGVFALRGSMDQAFGLTIAALLFPASQGMNQWQLLQIGRREYKANTIRISQGIILSSLALILAAVAGWTSPAALIGAGLGVIALQNLIQQRISDRSIPLGSEVEPGAIAYGLSTSKWDAFSTVANNVDRLFVYMLGSVDALAIYAVADRLPEVLKVNIQQLTNVLVPRFATRSEYTVELDRKLNIAAATLFVGLVLFSIVAVPFLLPLLYTESYRDAILYCQIILFSMAIGAFAVVKNAYINSRLDARSNRNITVGMSVVRIISSAVLVWRFGALGAALSTIVYRISSVLLVEYHLRRHHLTRSDA